MFLRGIAVEFLMEIEVCLPKPSESIWLEYTSVDGHPSKNQLQYNSINFGDLSGTIAFNMPIYLI